MRGRTMRKPDRSGASHLARRRRAAGCAPLYDGSTAMGASDSRRRRLQIGDDAAMVRYARVTHLEAHEAEAVVGEDAIDPHPRPPLVGGERVAEAPARAAEPVLQPRRPRPGQRAAQARQVRVAGDHYRSGLVQRGLPDGLYLQGAKPHVVLDELRGGALEDPASADLALEPFVASQGDERLAWGDGMHVVDVDRTERRVEQVLDEPR